MVPLRYLAEWKKLLLLFVGVYCILFYFSYVHLWKYGIRIAANTLKRTEGMLTSWNEIGSYSRSEVTINGTTKEFTNAETLIAIGSGITSRKLGNISENNIGDKFQFFHTLLPTFCRTASRHFVYKFYLAYDSNDRVFTSPRLRDAFRRQFHMATTSGSCSDRGIIANLSSLVECNHTGNPAWAQNDAMLEAYIDNVDYFYRINDDTRMLTGGWTEKFISTLESYDPPRVGVVGPRHSGGNLGILTYDFVHRTHLDIFGFYYPRLFTDWYGDRWITDVYKPGRSTKIGSIHLAHTQGLGRRYHIRYTVRTHLPGQLAHDIDVIKRWASYFFCSDFIQYVGYTWENCASRVKVWILACS